MTDKAFSVETGTTSKYHGKCSICKTETSLATVRVHTGLHMNYSIIKSCPRCSQKIHDIIEIILTALVRKE